MMIVVNRKSRSPIFCKASPTKTAGSFVRNYINTHTEYECIHPQNILSANHIHMENGRKSGIPWNVTSQHRPYRAMINLFRDFLDKDLPIWGTVRHPYDRFVSQLRFMSVETQKQHFFPHTDPMESKSFFATNMWQLFLPQHYYYFDDGHQVGEYVKIEEVQGEMLNVHGVEIDFGADKHWTNEQAMEYNTSDTSPNISIEPFELTDSLKELCYFHYKKDFELLGYDY